MIGSVANYINILEDTLRYYADPQTYEFRDHDRYRDGQTERARPIDLDRGKRARELLSRPDRP